MYYWFYLLLGVLIKNIYFLQFDRATKLFGEHNSIIQPNQFFNIFDSFLAALSEACQDNKSIKKRCEEDERRVRHEVEVSFECVNTNYIY